MRRALEIRRVRSDTHLDPESPSRKPVESRYGARIVFAWEARPELRYPFIARGYRLNHSIKEALLSAFQLHCETWNVWTHMFGVFLFSWLLVHVCQMGAPSQMGAALGERLGARLGQLRGALSSSVGGPSGGDLGLGGDLTALAARLMTPTEVQEAWGRVPSLVSWPLAGEFSEAHPAIAALFALPFAQSACRSPATMDLAQAAYDPAPSVQLGDAASAGGAADELSAVDRARRLLLSADAGHVRQALLDRIDCVYSELAEVVSAPAALDGFTRALGASAVPVERWPLVAFVASAMICLGFSVAYHLFGLSMGPVSGTVLQSCDYTGIICLIVGSGVPCVYYGFYDAPTHRTGYLLLLFVSGALTCAANLLLKGDRWRNTRTLSFIGLGVFELIPLAHALFYHNFDQKSVDLCLGVGQMGAVYLAGTVVFATRFPESMAPTKFDIFFSSHQWWHCFVVAAAYLHFKAVLQLWAATSIGISAANF